MYDFINVFMILPKFHLQGSVEVFLSIGNTEILLLKLYHILLNFISISSFIENTIPIGFYMLTSYCAILKSMTYWSKQISAERNHPEPWTLRRSFKTCFLFPINYFQAR